MAWWSAILGPIGELIGTPIKQWGERKKIKVEAKMEVEKLRAAASVESAKAVVELARSGQKIEADWDGRAQEQMKFSWKDEALMIILFFPVVLLFLSVFFEEAFQQKVIKSVNALEQFPEWYIILLCGIVAAIFGLRWLIAPIITRMKKKDADTQ